MDTRKKILAVAIIAALVGGVVGAFAFRAPGSNTEAALAGRTWEPSSESTESNDLADISSSSSTEAAYRDGFNEGFATARNGSQNNHAIAATERVYRNYGSGNGSTVTRQRYATNSPTYVQPRQRSFWDKHRDKLTVAMGAGGGAILGGLIGGKKGAAIGALAGGGGSALYTYKLRKKNRRY